MSDPNVADHYETLQISPNADGETIHRVFRLLAQRYHPDNPVSGNDDRFRHVHEAYLVLCDPEERARYDVAYASVREERWRIVREAVETRRASPPSRPDDGTAARAPRVHVVVSGAEELVARDDQSNLIITADGVDFLEQHPVAPLQKRLPE